MACIHMNNSSISLVKIRFTTFAVDIDCICFEKGKEKTILQLKISGVILKILVYYICEPWVQVIIKKLSVH